jgi:hypothetical protein
MNLINQLRIFYFCSTYLVNFVPRPDPQVRILNQKLGPTAVASEYGGHIKVPLENKKRGVDGIGIGGSYLQGKRAIVPCEAPVRHTTRDFFPAEAPARKATRRFGQGEDKPEHADLRDCQNNRYPLEHVFDHGFLS